MLNPLQNQHRPAPPSIRSTAQGTARTDGSLIVVAGATRTGKTTWVAGQVKAARRLLAWDGAEDWSLKYHCHRITDISELAQAVKPNAPDRRLAFVAPVTAQNFAYFCRLAWIFIRVRPGTLIVEELADVTSPGKAPVYWGEIIRKGLRYGPTVYALTQRPSESDKTVMGNASILHCHQMARLEDSRYMARELRVSDELVESLLPYHWIERDRRSRALTNGRTVKR